MTSGGSPRTAVDGTRPPTREAFGRGSVSLGIYVYDDPSQADPIKRVDTMLEMAALAERLGFDGVSASEHHRGRTGYMPNPLQLLSWYLEQCPGLWVAPCPLILPLRVPVVLAEEIAWLDARFPGRVGGVVAAGADDEDFAAVGASFDGRIAAFEAGLLTLSALLSGEGGTAAQDPALRRCADVSIPLASASMTKAGVRRAARCGVGVAFGRTMWARDATGTTDPMRALLEEYATAGGTGPRIYTAAVFVGDAPDSTHAGLAAREVAGPSPAQLASVGGHPTVGADAETIVANLVDAWDAGMESFNLRVPYNGISVSLALEQMHAIAEEVLPPLRAAVGVSGT